MAWMAGGMLGAAALNYYGSQQQADTMAAANQPLPTYYQHIQNPQQAALWGGITGEGGLWSNMQGGMMPQMTAQGAPAVPGQAQMGAAPTYNPVATGTYNMPAYNTLGAAERAAIEQPYQRGMEMAAEQLNLGGQLGAPRAGASGAAAQVLGEMGQQAAPNMALAAYQMRQPFELQAMQQQYGAGLQAQGLGATAGLQQLGAQNQAALLGQSQQYGANMLGAQFGQQAGMANLQAGLLPYQQLPGYMQMGMGDTLVGHHPQFGEVQPQSMMPENWDPQAYLEANPDVAANWGADPWSHYQLHGQYENRELY